MIRALQMMSVGILILVISTSANAQSANTPRDAGTRTGLPSNCGGNGIGAPGDEQANGGLNLANLDRSVSPCDDFFQFADGGWFKHNPIPADQPYWGVSVQLDQANQAILHQILEEASKDKGAKPGTNWQKIGDFYGSCMDESQVNAAGIHPLDPELKRIAEIKDGASLQAEVARLQREGVNAIFGFSSEQDLKDSTRVIAAASQAGLGLPERDYYLRDDDKSKELRNAYVKHVTSMFQLMGDEGSTAAAEANTVLGIETTLAKASTKRVDLRDPEKNYHPMTLESLRQFTPNLSWAEFLKQIGAPSVSEIDIGQLDFFQSVNGAWTSVSISDWKIYLRWHLVHAFAARLSIPFVDENFNFYSHTLTGTEQQLPRWRRCTRTTDAQLGEALGQYYVERVFPPAAKASALAMVKNIVAAMRADLSTLDWMSPPTREAAIRKLDAIVLKIGYPDKWRSYAGFDVVRGPYVLNVMHGNEFNNEYDYSKIGKPLDRTVWDISPPTVNAYYNDNRNEIVFPAGILQPPYFDAKRDDAVNYGEIGGVIGHELTHGFDDEGSKFDAQGNLKNWWTPEDLKNFQARGECILKQFDAYQIEPGLNENGKLVEGESIADLGGLTIAYAAFQNTLVGKPAPPLIDGFTADQRFFLGYASGWTDTFRPELARLIVQTDPHPLSRFRVIGPLSNMPSFAKAFDCPANSPMVRPAAERCRVW